MKKWIIIKVVFLSLAVNFLLQAQSEIDEVQTTSLHLQLNVSEIKIKNDRDVDDDGEFHFWRKMLGTDTRLPASGEITRRKDSFIKPTDPNLGSEAFWQIAWEERGTLERKIEFDGWESDQWPDSDDQLPLVSMTLDLTSFQFLTTHTTAKLECPDYDLTYTIQSAPPISSQTHPDSSLGYEKSALALSWELTQPAVGILGYSYLLDEKSTTQPDENLEGTHNSLSLTLEADTVPHTLWFHVRVQDKLNYWSNTGHFKIHAGKFRIPRLTEVDSEKNKPNFQCRVFPNFPNPFNAATTIRYEILQPGRVNLVIYNLKGQIIKSLVSNEFAPGIFQVIWDGTDINQAQAASGIYLVQFRINSEIQTLKITLLR